MRLVMLSHHLTQHHGCHVPSCLEGQSQAFLEQYLLENQFEARNNLVMLHLPRIRRIAKAKIAGTTLELSDVCHTVVVELIPLIDRYDIHNNVPFVAFSHYRICGAIVDIMRSLDTLSKGSRCMLRLYEHVTCKLGHPPERPELEALCGKKISNRLWNIVLEESSRSGSLFTGLDSLTRCDDQEADYPSGAVVNINVVETITLKTVLRVALQVCTPREIECIKLHYVGGLRKRTIGSIIGLTEGRVNQLITSGLKRIRSVLISH